MRRLAAPRRALARALVAAAVLGSPLPAQAIDLCTDAKSSANPVGTTKCPGVRPGALLTIGESRCTAGFLFVGSDRRRYLATAGHCAYHPDPTTDRTDVWKAGAGPVAKDADGKQIGRFAYASMVGDWTDFALIRLDNGVVSSPEMCHFGGPTGIAADVHTRDMLVRHYGHGTGMQYLPARTGEMFWGLYRTDYVFFYGAASTGDSGGPVTDKDGNAIGLITDLTTPFTGNVGVNRLPPNIAAATKALKLRSLTLLTAPTR